MTSPEPAVPPQAFDAAWAAWHSTEGFKARLTAALEAAAPHLEAAARERCAQLADEVGATYHATPGGPRMPSVITPFGALLRQGGEGGGT